MGKNPAGKKSHGEYLCSLSVNITAETTANLFSEFIFEFKKEFNKSKLNARVFTYGRNSLLGKNPAGKNPMGNIYVH